MVRRRRARARREFPARLARFKADEWKQTPEEALRVWGKREWRSSRSMASTSWGWIFFTFYRAMLRHVGMFTD